MPDDDGVLNADDACSFTSNDVVVEENGCTRDYDADGIPDYLDKCSETSLGNMVNTDGCSLAFG